MTHTPTPWRIEEGTTLIWGDCNPDDNTDAGMGYPITECRVTPISTSSWCKAPYTDEGESNAAHIVKCVNLHDELVEIAKTAFKMVDDPVHWSVANPRAGGFDEEKLRETLKKAGAL